MATFGDFDSQRELSRGALITTYSAARRDAPDRDAFAVRLWQASSVMSGAESEAGLRNFREQTQLLETLTESGAHHWPVVHAAGEVDGGAYYVADRYEEHCGQYIRGRVVLPQEDLYRIVRLTVAALRELERIADRPHGNLKPSNVLVDIERGKPRVALSDPLPGSRLDLARDRRADQRAIGELIHALVLHRVPGELAGPVAAGPAWKTLGSTGEKWRALCEELLNPEPGAAMPSLEEIARRLDGMAGRGKRNRGRVAAGVVVGVVLLGGAGVVIRQFVKPEPSSVETQARVDIEALADITDQETGWFYQVCSATSADDLPDSVREAALAMKRRDFFPPDMLAEINRSFTDLPTILKMPKGANPTRFLLEHWEEHYEPMLGLGDDRKAFDHQGGIVLTTATRFREALGQVKDQFDREADRLTSLGWTDLATRVRTLGGDVVPPERGEGTVERIASFRTALRTVTPVAEALGSDYEGAIGGLETALDGLGLGDAGLRRSFLDSIPRAQGAGDGDIVAELNEISALLGETTNLVRTWQQTRDALAAESREANPECLPKITADRNGLDASVTAWLAEGSRRLASRAGEFTEMGSDVQSMITQCSSVAEDPEEIWRDIQANYAPIDGALVPALDHNYRQYYGDVEVVARMTIEAGDKWTRGSRLYELRDWLKYVRTSFRRLDSACATLAWMTPPVQWQGVDPKPIEEARRARCLEQIALQAEEIARSAASLDSVIPAPIEIDESVWGDYPRWLEAVEGLVADAMAISTALDLGFRLDQPGPETAGTVDAAFATLAGAAESAGIAGAVVPLETRVASLRAIASTDSIAELPAFLDAASGPDVAVAAFARAHALGDRHRNFATIRNAALDTIAGMDDETRRGILTGWIDDLSLERWREWERTTRPGEDARDRFRASIALLEPLGLTENDVGRDDDVIAAKFALHRLEENAGGLSANQHAEAGAYAAATLADIPAGVPFSRALLEDIANKKVTQTVDLDHLAPVLSAVGATLDKRQSHRGGEYLVFNLGRRKLTFRYVETPDTKAYLCVDETPIWLFDLLVKDIEVSTRSERALRSWRRTRRGRFEAALQWKERIRFSEALDGTPKPEHPMQWISPRAACLAAGQLGCRLPTQAELLAAKRIENGAPNLGGAEFWSVWVTNKMERARVGGVEELPWDPPDLGGRWYTEMEKQPAPPAVDDGIVLFDVTNVVTPMFRHVTGNVGEMAWQDAASILPRTVATAFNGKERFRVVGGSAFTMNVDPWTPVGGSFFFDALWTDVGFRLAFDVEAKAISGPDLVGALRKLDYAALYESLSSG